MKRIYYLTAILVLGLIGCNQKAFLKKIVPDNVNKFAIAYVSEIHKGNIDSCMALVIPEINNLECRQFLENSYTTINSFSLDTLEMINARKNTIFGFNEVSNYGIDYEYKVKDKYLYVTIGVREQSGKLSISAIDYKILDEPLSKTYAFTLKNKDFLHYMFLCFSILMPIFIIVTLIFAIKTPLKRKWLWIIGILLGFVQVYINWTTGQVGLNLFKVQLLGAGLSKMGYMAPWFLSFSLPIVAISFWNKRYWDKREAEAQKRLDERMKNKENQEKNE